MITRIFIDNFRCFSNFEFRPERINLLLGANGSGKSSFVDALDRVRMLVLDGRPVADLFPGSERTRWDARTTQRIELDLTRAGKEFRYSATLDCKGEGAETALIEERVTCGDRTLFHFVDGEVRLHNNDGVRGSTFAIRGSRSFLAGIERRPETTDLFEFLDGMLGLSSLKLEPARIGAVTQDEQASLAKDGSNFASWYRHLSQEHTGALSGLFDSLGKVLPGLDSLALKGAGKQGRTRDLVAVMSGGGLKPYEVDFDTISDGQRALVVLYSMLLDMGTGEKTVLLDEPENYVGLAELQPWLHKLDSALGSSGQLFLISHHPEVIDYLAADGPMLFSRPDGGPVRVERAVFECESGLKASEQIARGFLDAS